MQRRHRFHRRTSSRCLCCRSRGSRTDPLIETARSPPTPPAPLQGLRKIQAPEALNLRRSRRRTASRSSKSAVRASRMRSPRGAHRRRETRRSRRQAGSRRRMRRASRRRMRHAIRRHSQSWRGKSHRGNENQQAAQATRDSILKTPRQPMRQMVGTRVPRVRNVPPPQHHRRTIADGSESRPYRAALPR